MTPSPSSISTRSRTRANSSKRTSPRQSKQRVAHLSPIQEHCKTGKASGDTKPQEQQKKDSKRKHTSTTKSSSVISTGRTAAEGKTTKLVVEENARKKQRTSKTAHRIMTAERIIAAESDATNNPKTIVLNAESAPTKFPKQKDGAIANVSKKIATQDTSKMLVNKMVAAATNTTNHGIIAAESAAITHTATDKHDTAKKTEKQKEGASKKIPIASNTDVASKIGTDPTTFDRERITNRNEINFGYTKRKIFDKAVPAAITTNKNDEASVQSSLIDPSQSLFSSPESTAAAKPAKAVVLKDDSVNSNDYIFRRSPRHATKIIDLSEKPSVTQKSSVSSSTLDDIDVSVYKPIPKSVLKSSATKSFQSNNRKVAKAKKLEASPSRFKNKGRNFSEEEDLFVAKAYVSATENNIGGADQSSLVFQQSMANKFNLLCQQSGQSVTEHRTPSNLYVRWTKQIRRDTVLFLRHYKTHQENPGSGWNNKDIMDAAMEDFKTENGKAFRFPKCVPILLNCAKFAVILKTTRQVKPYIRFQRKQPPYTIEVVDNSMEEAAIEASIENIPTNDMTSGMGGNLPRPMGVKAAKAEKRNTAIPVSKDTNEERQVIALEATAKAGAALVQAMNERTKQNSTQSKIDLFLKLLDTSKELKDDNIRDRCYNKLLELAFKESGTHTDQPETTTNKKNNIDVTDIDEDLEEAKLETKDEMSETKDETTDESYKVKTVDHDIAKNNYDKTDQNKEDIPIIANDKEQMQISEKERMQMSGSRINNSVVTDFAILEDGYQDTQFTVDNIMMRENTTELPDTYKTNEQGETQDSYPFN